MESAPFAHSWCQFLERVITFVLGGARSGKSRYVQNLAARSQAVLFIATARGDDDEMRAKIQRHRDDRPTHWQTVEEPRDLGRVLRDLGARQEFVIVDCLTLWISNLLVESESERREQLEQFYCTVRELRRRTAIVSNEVGSGIVPVSELGRTYRDVLGEVNQRVAALADNVVLLVAGIPLVLKGAVGQ